MIITITNTEIKTGAKGDYLYITYTDHKDNSEHRKAVFSTLKNKWGMCEVGATLELKQDAKYTVTDILPGDGIPPVAKGAGEGGTPANTPPRPQTSKQPYDGDSPAKRSSIEAQNAYTGIVSLMGCGVIKREEGIAQTALNYAMSKLQYWSSLGKEVEEKGTDTETQDVPMMTPEQGKEIWATTKKNGYTQENALAIMMRLYGVSSSKALTTKQADAFLVVLKSKKYLNEEIEPKDIPF